MHTMKVAVAVALLIVAVAGSAQFEAWQAKHGKTYKTEAEKQHRMKVFEENARIVAKHNLEADQGMHTFRLDTNAFADMTNAEYRTRFLGLRRHARKHTLRPTGTISAQGVQTLPDSVDWRTKGAVNAVKDQGQCGSCWAFSATTAMETAWFLKSGTLYSLSEQMCVDCCLNGADTCDQGGEMHDCYLQVIKQGGDEQEKDYPYSASSGGGCKYDPTKAVTKFASYYNTTSGDENALQVAASQTVVSIGIDASSIWFQLYSSGVYSDTSCKNGWNDLDHGVGIVGYGALNGTPYWLVRNSWGAFWGMQGYILMSRNKSNQCGVATDATVPVPA